MSRLFSYFFLVVVFSMYWGSTEGQQVGNMQHLPNDTINIQNNTTQDNKSQTYNNGGDYIIKNGLNLGYIATPQAWLMTRYAKFNYVDYYTGTANVNIPLYTYNDSDFKIPISACYTSNGFMPQKQTGPLGLDWFLNCGGVITREIRGIADDKKVEYSDRGPEFGFLWGQPLNYAEDSLLNLEIGDTSNNNNYLVEGYETTADIYHFNFNGYSGTFTFDGHRNIIVYNTDNSGTYKIEYNFEGFNIKGFRITTAKGYQYIFGQYGVTEGSEAYDRVLNGNFNKYYGQYELESSDTNSSQYNPIVSWYLTKIISPNGRVVTLRYDNGNLYGIDGRIIDNNTQNPYLVTSYSFGVNNVPISVNPATGVPNTRNYYRYASVVKTCYLSEIEVGYGSNKTNIAFQYGLKSCRDTNTTSFNTEESVANIAQFLKQLNSISVINTTSGTLFNCNFNYTTKDYRTLLSSVNVAGLGSYQMDYYLQHPFPTIESAAVDYWGFANGELVPFSNISGVGIDLTTQDQYISSPIHNPNWEYGVLGCLKTLTYPTQGTTTFEYEPNRAKYIVLKRQQPKLYDNEQIIDSTKIDDTDVHILEEYLAALNSYKVLFPNSDETGGVRVKTITDYSGNSDSVIKRYEYNAGIVSTFPRYYFMVGNYKVSNQYINFAQNSFDKQHIGYRNVTEIAADGGYTTYTFNDYQSNPDNYDDQVKGTYYLPNDLPESFNATTAQCLINTARVPNSYHFQRGKPSQICLYNANEELVKKEVFKYGYNKTPNSINGYTAAVKLCYDYPYSYKTIVGTYREIETNIEDYVGGNSMPSKVKWTFNNLDQVSTIDTSVPYAPNSNKEIIERQSMVYEHELNNFYPYYDAGAQRMVSRIYTDSIGGKDKEFMLSGEKVIYHDSTQLYKIKEGLSLNITGREVEPNEEFTYTIVGSNIKYDRLGNSIELTDQTNCTTAMIWGYNGRYPVAVVKNITYNQLCTLLGINGDTPLPASLTEEQINTLYSQNSMTILPQVFFYKPMVGITTEIDEKGYRTNYEYDNYGRLIKTSDQEGEQNQITYDIVR